MSEKRTRHPIGTENSPTNLTTSPLTRDGELATDSTDSKLKVRLGGATRAVVTEDQTQTLTNKTINADTNTVSNIQTTNLKAGVLNTSSTLASASDTQVPSALAVKTYTDAGDSTNASATATVQTNLTTHINNSSGAHAATAISATTSGVAGTNVQANLTDLKAQIDTKGTGNGNVVGPASATNNAIVRYDSTTGKLIKDSTVTVSDTGVVAGASIDATTNTLSNVSNTNISASAAIARTKLASGTANRLIKNDASGVLSENPALTANQVAYPNANGEIVGSSDFLVGANSLTLATTRHLEVQAATDSTTTGANASLAAFTAGAVRLTNVSLTSVANIPAGTNGQKLTIYNRTGVDVTIPDSSAAVGTAANRILTGTNGQITFTNNAALELEYDSTTARWQIIGGTGSGTGTASLDTILQLTASEQLTDWSTGNNAAFLGGGTLAGTFAKNTSTPLHGAASYSYTQAAGSLNDYLASATFTVDPRFRGQQVYLTLPYQYNGNTGDIQAIVYCVTTPGIITTTSDVIVGSNGGNQSLIVGCIIPSGCLGIKVGFQTKVLNSGKVFAFDDIQVASVIHGTTSIVDTEAMSLIQTVSIANANITGVLTSTTNRGILSYNSATGVYTAVRPCNVFANAAMQANSTTVEPTILKNGAIFTLADTVSSGGFIGAVSASFQLLAGETLAFKNTSAATSTKQWLSVLATATSDAVVTPTQQISSDTLPFTFKSTAIVDADPIGTFNTYTYAAAGNVTTISGTAPTQTVASMGTDGFLIFSRARNAASTAASPARVDIKVGKGLSSVQVELYGAAGKTSPAAMDYNVVSTAAERGSVKYYNKTTGILTIDGGQAQLSTNTSRELDTFGNFTSAYYTVAASTTPSITALPVLAPRIATLSDVKASGTNGGSSAALTTQTRTLNTIDDRTGIVTSLTANQFTLPRGRYYLDASAPAYKVAGHKARIRNITAGTTALIGNSQASSAADAITTSSVVRGEITVLTASVFELQHYTVALEANDGLGIAVTTGESEIYSLVKITKTSDL